MPDTAAQQKGVNERQEAHLIDDAAHAQVAGVGVGVSVGREFAQARRGLKKSTSSKGDGLLKELPQLRQTLEARLPYSNLKFIYHRK